MWRLKLFGTSLNNPEFGGSVPYTDQQDIQFGPFLLNRRRRGLTRDGVPIPTTGRASTSSTHSRRRQEKRSARLHCSIASGLAGLWRRTISRFTSQHFARH